MSSCDKYPDEDLKYSPDEDLRHSPLDAVGNIVPPPPERPGFVPGRSTNRTPHAHFDEVSEASFYGGAASVRKRWGRPKQADGSPTETESPKQLSLDDVDE